MAPIVGDRNTLAPLQQKHYSHIVVGGGLAGLVVASRLSEDHANNVLVIEAGGAHINDPRVDTPGLMATLWEDPEYDWGFWSKPQEHLNGRQIQQPRGKLLGGSSAVNYTAILYPTQKDFDAWTAMGNKGWTATEMQPYFRKFHTYEPGSKATHDLLSIDQYMDKSAQGSDGPLSVTFTDTYGAFNEAWMKVFDAWGMNDTTDPIKGTKRGAFTPPNSIRASDKTRSYAASAYYDAKVQDRKNLDVVTKTQVSKILFTEGTDDLVAKGVEVFFQDGSSAEIHGDEVILSAGAFQSPQILELSGIGNKHLLDRHGIKCLVDNPAVGENLQDHSFAAYSFEVADGQTSGDVLRDPKVIEALLNMYNESRSGPFTGMPISMAYLPMVDKDGPMENEEIAELLGEYLDHHQPENPGIQKQYEELRKLLLDPKESACISGILASQMHFNAGKTSMSDAMAKLLPGNYISFTAGLNHPFSRGTVHIQSNNPSDAPEIDPKYMSHPLDVEIMARCSRFVQKIATASPMKELLKPESRLPAELDMTKLDDARQASKERLYTTFHPSCTCAMLPRESGGVVNDRTRVYGTRNVRVVDASIAPMITLGNIQATVYAVAERAADLIKEDRRST